MKVALVHDTMHVYGGAEKVLAELHDMFPDAPIFTPVYDPKSYPEHVHQWDIRTSWIDRIPFAHKIHRALFMFYPHAMNAFDLQDYDLVISSSFNFAHHVVPGPNARHICYCHSPARFLWDAQNYARREKLGTVARTIQMLWLPKLRALDRTAAQGVTRFVSTSRLVRDRIRAFYGRSSEIIPPSVDLGAFGIAETPAQTPRFLLLMRLVGWKRPDIVIDACNRLRLPLIVAGHGREEDTLKRMAGPTITFVGKVDGAYKAKLLAECTALILPSVEDFGITPLEAMASGRPVVALGQGGALDTVIEGKTGRMFAEQTAESLARVLSEFDPADYDPDVVRDHALSFDRSEFRRKLLAVVAEVMADPLEDEVDAPSRRSA